MNARPVATGLYLLPFLYVAGLVFGLFSGVPAGVYFAFGSCVAIALLLGLGGANGQLVAVVLDLLLVGVVVASLLAAPTFGGLAAELTTGVLLGLPFLVSALAWRERSGLAHRTAALGLAIALGTALLATRETVLAGTAPANPTDFVQAFFTTSLTQSEGLAALAFGGPTPSLPLRAVFDPVFVGLCALAVGGVLLMMLRPQSGRGEPLPVAATLNGTSSSSGTPVGIPLSDAQRLVFLGRSRDRPPTGAWPPGLDAVLAAALAAMGFLAAAFLDPLAAPLVLVLAVVAGLAALALAGLPGSLLGRRASQASGPADGPR